MALATITIDEEFDVTLRITDRAGHPARVDGVPVWSVAPETLAEVVPSTDGMTAIVRSLDSVGEGGAVTVTADADLGAGIIPIVGVLSLAVVGGQAMAIELNAGTPRTKDAGNVQVEPAAPRAKPAKVAKQPDDEADEDDSAE